MTGRELSRPFAEYSSDWVRANVRPPQPIGERMTGTLYLDAATDEQIERANAAVEANLNDDGSPKWDSAQGYACALTAIMQSDTRPLTGGVTEEMVEAGWEAFNQHDDYRTAMREAYLAMKGEEK
jgi:hypothetical protein